MLKIEIVNNSADEESLAICVQTLRLGGVICYPTETFYALGIDFQNAEAVRNLYALKGRDDRKGLPCIASDREVVERYCNTSHPLYDLLASQFWPGPLTVVLRSKLQPTETIAVRVSSHPIAQQLAKALDSLLISTSANLSGESPVTGPENLTPDILRGIAILIDAGPTKGGNPSTIVSLVDTGPRILRQGAIPESKIMALI